MGKVSYRPRKGQAKTEEKRKSIVEKKADQECNMENKMIEESEHTKITIEECAGNQEQIQSTKIVGDLGCDYHVYIEDYVYTYLYQLAAADYTKESSAALVGQSYSDSKEILVKGIIPICMDKLQKESEWIDMTVIEDIENERKKYFSDQQIIGWMHMQPGYGTMLTMKELKEHQNVFEGNGTVCMLVDAINKIETLFVYEEDELKEQSGYCMYYERNEQMQQYMLDHPFNTVAKEEMKDTVVNQFREIGKIRKAEYIQKKNLNLTVIAASIILIALTAVIVKMNGNKTPVNNMQPVANTRLTTPVLQNDGAVGDDPSNPVMTITDQEGQETMLGDQSAEESLGENISEVVEEYDTYTVEAGDTLADICYKQYGNAERSAEVAKFNELDNTNELYVGQQLKMPK